MLRQDSPGKRPCLATAPRRRMLWTLRAGPSLASAILRVAPRP